jgi:hypothetical protein
VLRGPSCQPHPPLSAHHVCWWCLSSAIQSSPPPLAPELSPPRAPPHAIFPRFFGSKRSAPFLATHPPSELSTAPKCTEDLHHPLPPPLNSSRRPRSPPFAGFGPSATTAPKHGDHLVLALILQSSCTSSLPLLM